METGGPGLQRVLSWREGAGFTIAAVLGSGILILPAVTANLAGPASLVAWAVMAVLIVPLAVVLGRLATAFPHAGGIAEFVRQAFGPRWGRITGILYIGTVPMGGPIAALIGAAYLGGVVGLSPHATVAAASLILVASVALNVLGVELSGRTVVFVVIGISAILLLAVGTAAPYVRMPNFQPWLPHGWLPVGKDLALLFWAFVGWEMLAHMAEEFRNPARDVMRAMLVAIVVVDLLYLAAAVATVGTHMYGPGRTSDALAQLVGLTLGRGGEVLVGLLGFLISYGTIHTYVAGFSRLVYAEARAGNLPAWLHQLHPRHRTPTRILWLHLVPWGIVMAWTYAGGLHLETLIAWPSAAFIALYILAMAAGYRLLATRFERVLAAVGLVVTGGALLFLGWIALYPAAILLIFGLLLRGRDPSRRQAGDLSVRRG
ncbi:MAG: amino acid permease [Clostridia bacterium]